jgi:hypothetical protein
LLFQECLQSRIRECRLNGRKRGDLNGLSGIGRGVADGLLEATLDLVPAGRNRRDVAAVDLLLEQRVGDGNRRQLLTWRIGLS